MRSLSYTANTGHIKLRTTAGRSAVLFEKVQQSPNKPARVVKVDPFAVDVGGRRRRQR